VSYWKHTNGEWKERPLLSAVDLFSLVLINIIIWTGKWWLPI